MKHRPRGPTRCNCQQPLPPTHSPTHPPTHHVPPHRATAPRAPQDDWWVVDDAAAPTTVPAASILRTLDHEYSQRQDRSSNPHGEHAHDVYKILDELGGGVYRGPRQQQQLPPLRGVPETLRARGTPQP